MSKKAKRLPKIYYTAPNGIKIEMNALNAASFYAKEQIRTEFAKAFQVPKDMLFPTEVLALTDKNKLEGSIEVTFKCDEVSKCLSTKEKNHTI
jgi:hypothetical protein